MLITLLTFIVSFLLLAFMLVEVYSEVVFLFVLFTIVICFSKTKLPAKVLGIGVCTAMLFWKYGFVIIAAILATLITYQLYRNRVRMSRRNRAVAR